MVELNRAGTYELLEFRIAHIDEDIENPNAFIDIKGLIHEWELHESMESGHLFGTAIIYDSLGILDDLHQRVDSTNHWIRGEERIRITYSDWYPDHEPMEHEMFLYSVTDVHNVTRAKDALRAYKIHFVSIEKFLTERYLVRRGFRNKLISDNVKELFDEYWERLSSDYKKTQPKTLYKEATDGPQNLIVPNYSPEQAMHFFARKAYSGESPTQTWRFFENRNGYYFVPHDSLEESQNELDGFNGEIKKYIRINKASKDQDSQGLIMLSILDMRQSVYINTLKDMLTGSYYSSLTELDIPNRTPTFVEYRYLDEYESYPRTSFMRNLDGLFPRPKHSKKFVDTHLNTLRDRMVVRDYGYPNDNLNGVSTRPETYYTNSYNEKRVSHSHYDSNKIVLKVYGDTEIVAGSIIELEIPKVDNQLGTVTDTLRSGVYLIESIKNIFSEEMYYQELTVSASGVYAKPERANEYVRERLPLSEFTERDTFLNDADGGRDVDGTRAAATPGPDDGLRGSSGESVAPDLSQVPPGVEGMGRNSPTQQQIDAIYAAADAARIPRNVYLRLIAQESNFNPNAFNGGSQATGYAQIVPATGRQPGYGVTPIQDVNNPTENLRFGAEYLGAMYNEFGRWDYALAAYNAGPGNVEKYNGVPPFDETRNYVDNILGPGFQ